MRTIGPPRINPSIDLVVGLVPVRPIDLQLQAARRFQLEQIARVFVVPASLLSAGPRLGDKAE